MGLSSFDEKIPYAYHQAITSTDGLATKGIGTTTDPARRIDAILASNSDTIAHVIDVSIQIGGAGTFVGSVSVPAGQGFAGTPAIDLLASAFPTSVAGIALGVGNILQVQLEVAMNAGKTIQLAAFGGLL